MAEQAASCDRSSKSQAEVWDNVHPKEIQTVIGVLEELKAKSKGQYYENIIEKCHTEHGWTECMTASLIESAIQKDAIYDVMYRGKKAFRIKERNTAIIRDMNGSDSNSKQQNDLSFQIDYRDFKQHVWDSLADLNSSLRNLSSEMNNINSKFSPIQPKSAGNGTPDRSIISVLEARISSLERQLDEKQRVIELLIGSGPKQQANPTQASSNNNAQNSSHVSSNSETQNKQLGINTTSSPQLGADSTTHGKKTKNKKKKTPNNNNGEEVQRPQENETVLE